MRKSHAHDHAHAGFREWWWYNLYHWPHTPEKNIRPKYDALTWRSCPSDLRAWQRGHTGYPLVDAGMRELWVTGTTCCPESNLNR